MISKYRLESKIKRFLLFIGLIIVLVWSLFPIYITIVTSFKSRLLAFRIPPAWIFRPTFENYKFIFYKTPFGKYFINSIIIAFCATAISLILGSLAAYPFARFKFKGKMPILFMVLATRMFPPMSMIIPMFLLGRSLHIIDTRLVLIIAYTGLNLPFTIWMMQGFLALIPSELDDCAMIDGCTRFQALFRIVLPLTGPGLAATAIFCVMLSWNDYIFALILTGVRAKTLPVAITSFLTIEGVEWGNLSAAATVVMLPIMLFSIAVRNRLVSGMTMGAVK